MSEATAEQKVSFRGAGNAGFFIGLIGTIGALALMFGGDKDLGKTMTHSWVFAWGVFMALALGCFGLTLLHHTVRGSWGQAVIRIFEAGGGALALFILALLFLPIAANFGVPYGKWWPLPLDDKYVVHKELWLNPTSFGVRFVLYFLIWIGLALLLRRSSLRQEVSGDAKEQQRRANWSAPGLVLFVLTITLASTDWFMSIDPHWFSTIFGPLYMIVGANLALGLCTAIVCFNAKKAPYNQVVSFNLTRDLGNLCFAFTMLWIYFALSQFLIIWSGNLPEFTSFYYERQYDSQFLLILGAINVMFGWFVPWMALLAPRAKKNLTILLWVSSGIVLMRLIDLYWNIMPFMRGGEVLPFWTDALALVAVGGFWLWAFGKTSSQAELLPQHDTRLQEALRHEHA